MKLWFVLALGCSFGASTTVTDDTDTGSFTLSDTEAESEDDDATEPSDTDEPTETESDVETESDLDEWDQDQDGDGYSPNEGDCDDRDDAVNPDAETDDCDGAQVDQDCDDVVDEEAVDDDPYEPNDSSPTDLGDLDGNVTEALSAWLHNDDDVDRFQFYTPDHWYDSFSVTITLTSIPEDATYRLTLNRLLSDGDASLGQIDQTFGSDSVSLTLEDASGDEDGGVYEVVVEAISGADCSTSYLLGLDRD